MRKTSQKSNVREILKWPILVKGQAHERQSSRLKKTTEAGQPQATCDHVFGS